MRKKKDVVAEELSLEGFSERDLVESVPPGGPPVAKAVYPGYDHDLLEDSLSTTVENDNTIKSVSKELFTQQNIELKTQLTHDEINHLTRISFLHQKFGIRNVTQLRTDFLTLRVSLERKSRAEFIDALQTEKRNAQGGSFMNRLFGMGGGNNNP